MKITLVFILLATVFFGCGPTAYQVAKTDFARQYAELDQIADSNLRAQRFAEIQQRELILETQEAQRRQIGAQLFSAWAISQAIQNQPQQPIPVVNFFGWSR